MKRLDLVVGPNGAGKSSFVDLVLASELPGVVFVNADLLAQQHWPEDPTGASYDAARMAADVRDKLIRGGHPFIAETVFSHPSKLDLIRPSSPTPSDWSTPPRSGPTTAAVRARWRSSTTARPTMPTGPPGHPTR